MWLGGLRAQSHFHQSPWSQLRPLSYWLKVIKALAFANSFGLEGISSSYWQIGLWHFLSKLPRFSTPPARILNTMRSALPVSLFFPLLNLVYNLFLLCAGRSCALFLTSPDIILLAICKSKHYKWHHWFLTCCGPLLYSFANGGFSLCAHWECTVHLG